MSLCAVAIKALRGILIDLPDVSSYNAPLPKFGIGHRGGALEMKQCRILSFAGLFFAFLCILFACGMSGRSQPGTGARTPSGSEGRDLSPEQEHAGEIMAYLLRVVLGQVGPMGSREKWAAAGLTGPLDLDRVYMAMTDPEKNIWEVMPIDMNLLPLSQVLFYYDETLSFTKGKSGWMSLYPAPEFLAIRMLLLRKINRGEKIRLGPLIKREALLFRKEVNATAQDLEQMNLRPEEWQLIRQIVEREPVLYRYLLSPFLVRALHQAGAVERDEFVGRMIRKASYRPYPLPRHRGSKGKELIRISVLPSMTKGFYYGGGDGKMNEHGFRANEELLKVMRDLEKGIKSYLKESLEAWVLSLPAGEKRPKTREEWEGLWRDSIEKKILFCAQDQRPLAIYPGCTEEVIRDVCPDVDFTVILIGKDIYLALSQEDERRPSGNPCWAYVDMDDVEQGRMGCLCERIAESILERLKSHIRVAVGGLPLS